MPMRVRPSGGGKSVSYIIRRTSYQLSRKSSWCVCVMRKRKKDNDNFGCSTFLSLAVFCFSSSHYDDFMMLVSLIFHSFLCVCQTTVYYCKSTQHTVWGEIKDDESFRLMDHIWTLPSHKKVDGLTFLDDPLHFELTLLLAETTTST